MPPIWSVLRRISCVSLSENGRSVPVRSNFWVVVPGMVEPRQPRSFIGVDGPGRRSLHGHRDPRHRRARRGDSSKWEITVGCSQASLRKDRPGEHSWFGQFRHRLRLLWGQGQMGSHPDGWIRIEDPRDRLEDFIRAIRQAARDADAYYQAALAHRREYALREAQTQRERQADPAKRTPAWQKIRPASTWHWPRPGSSSCCRAASRPRSRVLSAVRVGLPPDDLG